MTGAGSMPGGRLDEIPKSGPFLVELLGELLDELATFEPNLAAAIRLLASRAIALHRDGFAEAGEGLCRGFLDRWALLGLNEATANDAAEWVREWTPPLSTSGAQR